MRGREPHPIAAVNRALAAIRALSVTTAYPLLLALLDARDRNELDDIQLAQALRAVESFVLRRYVCGESSRGYGMWFIKACKELGKDPLPALLKFLRSKGWPSDEAFIPRFSRMNLYGSKYDRAVLVALELSLQASSEPVGLEKCTIEHVMPQTINEDDEDGQAWIEALGEEWRRTYGEWLHTPGNLTLVGYDYNIEMQKKRYELKRPVLEASKVYLNKYFSKGGPESWNKEAMEQRGKQLAELAAKLWAGPQP